MFFSELKCSPKFARFLSSLSSFDNSHIKCFHLQVRTLAEEEAVPGSTTMEPCMVYPSLGLPDCIGRGFQHYDIVHWQDMAGLFLIQSLR